MTFKLMCEYLHVPVSKQAQLSIDSTDICIYKQNGIITKAEAYKGILHINRYNTKCTWLQNFQSCRHIVFNV